MQLVPAHATCSLLEIAAYYSGAIQLENSISGVHYTCQLLFSLSRKRR